MDYTNESCSVSEVYVKVRKEMVRSYWVGALIGCSIGLVAVLMYILFCMGPTHFEKKFPDIVHHSWCTLNSDGTIMTINMPYYYFEETDAWNSIKEINEELDLIQWQNLRRDIDYEIEKLDDAWDEYYYSYSYNSKKAPDAYCEGKADNDKYEIRWTYYRYGNLMITYLLK